MLKDKCINVSNVLGTPHTGEVEIFDFVTERVKRRIAAKRENRYNNVQSEYAFISNKKEPAMS